MTSWDTRWVEIFVALAGDVPAGLVALGLSEHLRGELERNATLLTAPTLTALGRYTGVLYAALDPTSLRPAQRARLAVASALFGLLSAEDWIPAYRLSASSALPPWARCARSGVQYSPRCWLESRACGWTAPASTHWSS